MNLYDNANKKIGYEEDNMSILNHNLEELLNKKEYKGLLAREILRQWNFDDRISLKKAGCFLDAEPDYESILVETDETDLLIGFFASNEPADPFEVDGLGICDLKEAARLNTWIAEMPFEDGNENYDDLEADVVKYLTSYSFECIEDETLEESDIDEAVESSSNWYKSTCEKNASISEFISKKKSEYGNISANSQLEGLEGLYNVRNEVMLKVNLARLYLKDILK